MSEIPSMEQLTFEQLWRKFVALEKRLDNLEEQLRKQGFKMVSTKAPLEEQEGRLLPGK